MSPVLSDADCRAVVREALDSLPAEIGERLQNVAVIVEDHHMSEQIRELGYG